MGDNILLLASSAASIVKVLVDALKLAVEPPRWAPVALALLGGIVVVLLMLVADGQPLTAQTQAQAALAGLLAGGMAVGVTEVQKHVEQRRAGRRSGGDT